MFSPTKFLTSVTAQPFTAKAAIRCGLEILAMRTGLSYEQLVLASLWCWHRLTLLQR